MRPAAACAPWGKAGLQRWGNFDPVETPIRNVIMSIAKQSRESAMQTHQADYFGAYRTMKMMRDAKGVLVVEFHSNGGRCTFSAQHHTEVVDAFHRIAQDRANKIVILTGAEGDFIIGVDWNSFGDVSDPGVWSQIHDEGTQVLENMPTYACLSSRLSKDVRISIQT